MQEQDKRKTTKKSGVSVGYSQISDYALYELTALPQGGESLYRVLKGMLAHPAICTVQDFYIKSLAASTITLDFESTKENITPDESLMLDELRKYVVPQIQWCLKNRFHNYFLAGLSVFDYSLKIKGSYLLPFDIKELPPDTLTIERDNYSSEIVGIEQVQDNKTESIDIRRVLSFFRNASTYSPNGVSLYSGIFLEFKNSFLAYLKIPNLVEIIGNGPILTATGFSDVNTANKWIKDLEDQPNNKSKYGILAASGNVAFNYHEASPVALESMRDFVEKSTQRIYSALLIGQQNVGQSGNGGSYSAGQTLLSQFSLIFNGALKELEDTLNDFLLINIKNHNPGYTGDFPKFNLSPAISIESIIALITALNAAAIDTSRYDIEKILRECTPLQIKEEEKISAFGAIDNKPPKQQTPKQQTPQKEQPTKKRAFTPKRALTALESDLGDLEKTSQELVKWTEKSGQEIHKTIVAELKSALENATDFKDARSLIKQINNENLRDSFKNSISKLAEVSFKSVKSEYEKQAKQAGKNPESEKLKAFFSKSGFAALSSWVSNSKVKILASKINQDFESFADDYIDAFADEISARVEAEVMEALRKEKAAGKKIDDAVGAVIAGIAEQAGENYIKQAEKYGAELVGAFREIALGDLEVKALVRSAINDTKTCRHCADRDNKEYFLIDGKYIADDGEEAVDLPDVFGCDGTLLCRCFYLYRFAFGEN